MVRSRLAAKLRVSRGRTPTLGFNSSEGPGLEFIRARDTFVFLWRVRLVGQDTALSRPVHGFESRTRCQSLI
jgi:hypothetical protein